MCHVRMSACRFCRALRAAKRRGRKELRKRRGRKELRKVECVVSLDSTRDANQDADRRQEKRMRKE